MSIRFKLPEIGPRWYSLVLCPECFYIVKSTDDTKNNSEELICPDCGKIFTFEFNTQEPLPRIRIQSVPQNMMNYTFSRDGGITFSGNDQMKSFLYALMAWENFVDDKDKPVKLDANLKEQIFKQSAWGIPGFVLAKSQFLQKSKDAQEKN